MYIALQITPDWADSFYAIQFHLAIYIRINFNNLCHNVPLGVAHSLGTISVSVTCNSND